MKKSLISFIFLFLSVASVLSQVNENGDFELPDLNSGMMLIEGWRYSPDDTVTFADKEYDDSEWKFFKNHEKLAEFFSEDFNGFGWFRVKLIIPDSLSDETFIIDYILSGASELFIDGELVETLGITSPNSDEEESIKRQLYPVVLNSKSDTVQIALRYSQHKIKPFSSAEPFQMGIDFAESGIGESIRFTKELYSISIVFGFLLALSIIHFLLYVYYPIQKENLYFSLFVLTLSLIMLNNLFDHLSLIFFFARFGEIIGFTLFFLIFIFLLRFLYELFKLNKKIFKFFLIISLSIALTGTIAFNSYDIALSISVFVLIVDIFRTLILGLKKKMYGIVAGTLILILGIIYTTISASMGFSIDDVLIFYIVLSFFFLALPVAMSFLLARKSSEINKDLTAQLIKVNELSAETLAQEQEKQRILENQKEKLEQQVKERTKEIVKQKEELQEQNVQITDSITYAGRIQKAILGNPELIINKFKDAFIILKPHSIVSGDFYWFTEHSNTTEGDLQIIIAADCTGHGVPGAFMTVMGHDFLEEIINKQQIYLPHKILRELDKQVISNLKKQSSKTKVNDGMDIAVLTYYKSEQKVLFAGANNPLFYVRNSELIKIRGSKYAIGGDYFGDGKEKKFELHNIAVQANDKFYIFSDGFHDQFGGPKNRKYMIKPFKNLILKNSNLPMISQKQKIEEAFYTWKGTNPQTDDILIIGIEF